MRTLRAAEVDYGPDEILALRLEIIQLRDEALRQGDAVWSVRLSHAIALMAAMAEEMKTEPAQLPTPPAGSANA